MSPLRLGLPEAGLCLPSHWGSLRQAVSPSDWGSLRRGCVSPQTRDPAIRNCVSVLHLAFAEDLFSARHCSRLSEYYTDK